MKTKEDLFNDYGINSETQPQFINIVQGGKNIVINVSDISRVEPEDDQTKIHMRSKSHILIACNIERFVKLLSNVVLLDIDEKTRNRHL